MVENKHIECQSCGALLELGENALTASCPYCGSHSVIENPPSLDRPNPVFALTFLVTQKQAREAVREWARSFTLSFRRSGLGQLPVEEVRGVYLPAYLYSAVAHAKYSADIGENYTTTESYTTTDSKGRTVHRTRTVTKTEWRSLIGDYATYVPDIIVSASRGVSNLALEAIEPFDLRALRRYRPNLIAGWIAEEPSITQDECYRLAESEVVMNIGDHLGGFMPGDKHRNLNYNVDLDQEVIDFVLVPVWSFAIRYSEDKPPLRVLVNGQTGKTWGEAPISWLKVIVLVMIMMTIVGALCFSCLWFR